MMRYYPPWIKTVVAKYYECVIISQREKNEHGKKG